VLDVCAGVGGYTRLVTVLVAFAESDFRSSAVQRETLGVFQQNPRWWPTATGTTAEQCQAFLDAFARVGKTGDPVADAWQVQRWLAPDPRTDPTAFRLSPETQNYMRRVPLVPAIIRDRRLP
jgi:hypothetical protein